MKHLRFLQTLFFILLSFSFYEAVEGQDVSLSDSISISIPNSDLIEALQDVSEKTGLTFAYRSKLLEDKKIEEISYIGTINNLVIRLLNPFNICYTEQNGQLILHTSCRPKFKTISGYITDSSKYTPVPYVSVSIPNTSRGVIADHEGYFELLLDYSDYSDTLLFSCMGFRKETVIISTSNTEVLHVSLKQKVYNIPSAYIRPGQYKLKKVGNSKGKSLGSIYLDTHGQQTALYIANDESKNGTIESVEYFLSKKGNTKAPFRVRIYSVDSSGLPGEDLIKDAIVVKPEVYDGWFRINLAHEGIEFPPLGVFIAIEGVFPDDYNYYYGSAGFIELNTRKRDRKKENLLTYGQRLGYCKKGRKDTWHYSLAKVWFQLEKQDFGVMISTTIKYEINTDNYDQDNK